MNRMLGLWPEIQPYDLFRRRAEDRLSSGEPAASVLTWLGKQRGAWPMHEDAILDVMDDVVGFSSRPL